MGSWFSRSKKNDNPPPKKPAASQINESDVVKSKLKIAREKVNNYAKAKNNDIAHIEKQIKQELPAYEKTKNKKKLIPLLKAKKDMEKLVENAEVRTKLLSEKIAEVEMAQLNADTIDALEDSNKYIKEMQQMMDQKDWQGVIEDAKNKYQLEWPDDEEDMNDDPAFQELWSQLGGNKYDKAVKKEPMKKQVNVEVPQHQTQKKEQKIIMN